MGTIFILGNGFVELIIFLLLNVLGLPGPDGFGFIAKLPVPGGLFNLLGLWLLLFLLLFLFNSSFFILILNFIFIRLFLNILIFLVLNRLFNSLGRRSPQVDVEIDKLRIFLDQVPDGVLFQEIVGFLLQVQ